MSAEYPLRIQAVHEDNQLVYMSKGHHEPHAFMRALRAYGEEGSLSVPEYLYVKRTPANDGTRDGVFHFVDKGVRGAFPATFTFEYGEARYVEPAP